MKLIDKLTGSKNMKLFLLVYCVLLTAAFISHLIYTNIRMGDIEKNIGWQVYVIERELSDTESELESELRSIRRDINSIENNIDTIEKDIGSLVFRLRYR